VNDCFVIARNPPPAHDEAISSPQILSPLEGEIRVRGIEGDYTGVPQFFNSLNPSKEGGGHRELNRGAGNLLPGVWGVSPKFISPPRLGDTGVEQRLVHALVRRHLYAWFTCYTIPMKSLL
jgi:hypothetical protein